MTRATYLEPKALAQLREVVRRELHAIQGELRAPRKGNIPAGTPHFVCRVTSDVSARSGTTAGSGVGELNYLNTTTLTDVAVNSTVTVWNADTNTIATGKYVPVQQDTYGNWWALPATSSPASNPSIYEITGGAPSAEVGQGGTANPINFAETYAATNYSWVSWDSVNDEITIDTTGWYWFEWTASASAGTAWSTGLESATCLHKVVRSSPANNLLFEWARANFTPPSTGTFTDTSTQSSKSGILNVTAGHKFKMLVSTQVNGSLASGDKLNIFHCEIKIAPLTLG